MLMVLSPAKTLDYETPITIKKFSQPSLLNDSALLIKGLKKMSPFEVSSLMHISDKLGTLNFERYQEWQQPFTPDNARQAILAFKGDVYTGLNAETLTAKDLNWAQNHLRILSGLYGVLRPLDLMQAYRLEMGTRLENKRGNDLYEFWGERITNQLNEVLQKDKKPILVNLASNEYFKAVQPKKLNAEVITPVFKDLKGGKYKIISFFAKKARGMMARYIIDNRISRVEDLRHFGTEGYSFNAAMSSDRELVFTRDKP